MKNNYLGGFPFELYRRMMVFVVLTFPELNGPLFLGLGQCTVFFIQLLSSQGIKEAVLIKAIIDRSSAIDGIGLLSHRIERVFQMIRLMKSLKLKS